MGCQSRGGRGGSPASDAGYATSAGNAFFNIKFTEILDASGLKKVKKYRYAKKILVEFLSYFD